MWQAIAWRIGMLDPKGPRHYKAKWGSDEGAKPINGADLRLDFKVTVGLRVLILLPSIEESL